MYHQAKWDEPLILEYPDSRASEYNDILKEASKYIPHEYLRSKLSIPDLSEPIVERHFIRLSQMNYSVDTGFYPLGSCTMKYNPKILEEVVDDEYLHDIHPDQPSDSIQGILKILYELSKYLSYITGMDYFTFQPAAGAHGELTGVLIIKKYHEVRGDFKRDEIVIPDSAHGTNPASAKMAGFKVVEIPSGNDGLVDLDALESVVSERTAGMMLTNPNTLGLFERNIREITRIIHDAGGLMYYDGANLNAILGITRPGDMGFDIVHLNLHKTFGTPHGGGGPGAGPVGVKAFLKDFLPTPIIEYKNGRYELVYDLKYSIGRVHSFHGNISVLIKAYAYILLHGPELRKISEIAVLNSNYLMRKLERLPGIDLPYSPKTPRKHEFVISLKKLKNDTGVGALDVAKKLLDYGLHPPTIYFPLIVEEAFMIEPTESASLKDLDTFYNAMKEIINTAYKNPDIIKKSPVNTSVSRVDQAYGSRPKTMAPTHRWLTNR